MKTEIVKIKVSEVRVGQEIVEKPRTVTAINITEHGKRKLKFSEGKTLDLNDSDEIEVVKPEEK
jgi:hypothetical protein